ncbi:hypothetical protein SNK04_012252 [Fusarium graminearum]
MIWTSIWRPPKYDTIRLKAACVSNVDQETRIVAFQVAQRHITITSQSGEM